MVTTSVWCALAELQHFLKDCDMKLVLTESKIATWSWSWLNQKLQHEVFGVHSLNYNPVSKVRLNHKVLEAATTAKLANMSFTWKAEHKLRLVHTLFLLNNRVIQVKLTKHHAFGLFWNQSSTGEWWLLPSITDSIQSILHSNCSLLFFLGKRSVSLWSMEKLR